MIHSPLWQALIVSQALVWLPLIAGHQLHRRGLIPPDLAARLHSLNIALLTPLVSTMAVWHLDLSMAQWIWAPLTMSMMLTVATVLAWLLAPRLGANRAQIGTLTVLLPISNTGYTMAGFLTLLLISDRAFAYNALIVAPYLTFIFLVWFPMSRRWSDRFQRVRRRGGMLVSLLFNLLPLIGVVLGGALNLGGVPMAPPWVVAMRWTAYLGTAMVMFAIGSQLRLRRLGGPFRPLLLWVYAMKFLVYPAIIIAICLIVGLRGELAAALLLTSAAPCGVFVPAIATLYHLDIDLANAGYVWTTLIFMLIILPMLMLILRLPYFH